MKKTHTKFILFLGMIVTACDYEEAIVTNKEVIQSVTHTPNEAAADGVSKVTIKVTLPEETADSKRTVSFLASNGVFVESDKNVASMEAIDTLINNKITRMAFATLKGVQEQGPVTITVRVQNFMKEHEVNFTRAYPDTLLLTTDKIYIKPSIDSEAALTVQIKRNKGIPTSGQHISLTVTDSTGKEVGNFRNKTFQSDIRKNF